MNEKNKTVDPDVNEHPCECCGKLWQVHLREIEGQEHWICDSCYRRFETDEDEE